MAEWLGKGLQNLVQRFESASDLQRGVTRVAPFLLLYFDAVFLKFGWFSVEPNLRGSFCHFLL